MKRTLVLLTALVASVATSQEPEPTETPVEPEPAPAPTVEPATEADGCEPMFFACPTADQKPLEVCGDPVRYRFGALDDGSPELEIRGDFVVEERRHVRSMGHVVRFENEGYAYEVADMMGSGGGTPEEAEANNFVGVMVFKGESLVATVPCTELPTTDWDALRALQD